MSNTTLQIDAPSSRVKQALDRRELVERVPVLQRKVSELTGDGYKLVLKLPSDEDVIAYADELAEVNARRDRNVDLKAARREFKRARLNYETRVRWRINKSVRTWSDGGLFVSLSAILEARAESMFWRKVVKEHEHVEQIKKQNGEQVGRHRLKSLGLAY